MADKLGVVIVGCGYWGVNYVRLFSELPRTQVVAICEQRPERLQEINKRFPNIYATSDLEEALALEGVEAAIISTTATTHYEVTKQCLLADKHVMVEKPMATTTADAEKLVHLAEARNLKLMVGHIFLYNAGVQLTKSYIKQGKMGDLYYLYARRTNLGPIRHDVNAVWDLATHDVSIFNHFMETTPEWVSAVGGKYLHTSREDVGFIVLGYPNEVLAHIHVSWADPAKVREIVVVGSEKRVVFNDLDPLERVKVFEKGIAPSSNGAEPANYGEYHFDIRDGDIYSPKVEASEPLKSECNHFVDCVLNDEHPISDGYNGLEVVHVMEAINRSVAERGRPVEIKWEISQEIQPQIISETSYDHSRRITSSVHGSAGPASRLE